MKISSAPKNADLIAYPTKNWRKTKKWKKKTTWKADDRVAAIKSSNRVTQFQGSMNHKFVSIFKWIYIMKRSAFFINATSSWSLHWSQKKEIKTPMT